MQTKTVVRIGAVAFVAVAITASAMQARMSPGRVEQDLTAASMSAEADPLRAELERCQSLGAAGADAHECLRAWAENRRRFLAPGARPEQALPTMNAATGEADPGTGMSARSVNRFDVAAGEER
jgi:conjugative transfer region protein TrbK